MANPLYLRDAELRQGIELLYFAFRDLNTETDKVLATMKYGRAHHRVIHFVGRNPGITVNQLLGILEVTKQSLSRVLGQLLTDDIIEQSKGIRDRRQRLLHLTARGEALEDRLSTGQRAMMARAFRAAGAEAVEGFREVLEGLTREFGRDFVNQPPALPRPNRPPGT